mgnify:CR=1 FL=1
MAKPQVPPPSRQENIVNRPSAVRIDEHIEAVDVIRYLAQWVPRKIQRAEASFAASCFVAIESSIGIGVTGGGV